MQHTQRDLRAADVLAMIFVGVGLVLATFGVIGLVGSASDGDDVAPPVKVAGEGEAASQKAVAGPVKRVKHGGWRRAGVAPLVAGIACLCLGGAVCLKVRQLQRTGGREPDEYDGVPEA